VRRVLKKNSTVSDGVAGSEIPATAEGHQSQDRGPANRE
jgi:hypothetical protein